VPGPPCAENVARALVIRDLIGQHGFTQEHYDELTRQWRNVIGPLHPDDAAEVLMAEPPCAAAGDAAPAGHMMSMNTHEFLADVIAVDIAHTLSYGTEIVGAPYPSGNRHVLHDAGNEDLLLPRREMVDVGPGVAVRLPKVQRTPGGLSTGSSYWGDGRPDAELMYTAREGMNALAVLLCREADQEESAPSVSMAPTLDEAIRTLLIAAQQEEFGANDALDAATSRINDALAPGLRFTTEDRTGRIN